jgi:pyruvate/2-oxoglutarate dehydrogenase complex dihydrolipoamide acyltransferase (E2) component
MTNIIVSADLWSTRMLPEGIVEKWFVTNGDIVKAGDRIAQVKIEDARHELVTPVAGRLMILSGADSIVEPDSVIGQVSPILSK